MTDTSPVAAPHGSSASAPTFAHQTFNLAASTLVLTPPGVLSRHQLNVATTSDYA